MQLRLPLCASFLALVVLVGTLGCDRSLSDLAADKTTRNPVPPSEATRARLQSFFTVKQQQALRLYQNDNAAMPPRIANYFKAATKEDWRAVTRSYEQMRRAKDSPNNRDLTLAMAGWQTVAETFSACEYFTSGHEKYALAFGNDIIKSLPAGCVYFGGTDPGRFLVTALMKSHIDAEPFFLVTQNQLADGTYLRYLESMYTGKLYTPSTSDSQKAFQEYMEDAQQRMQKGQLRPGEDVRVVDNRVQVSGQVAVMNINALLVKVIFDRNTDKEFFIEESFPLEWMYPYLTPHQLVMKLNRQPLSEISEEIVRKDHDFWTDYTGRLIGSWVTYETPVADIAKFARKVYGDKDYVGFKGDGAFASDDDAQKAFSKLRSSIAGVYAWRLNQAGEQADASNRMFREAEFAFKQAHALCPYSPEALYRYVQLLAGARRFDDAILLAQTSFKLESTNSGLRNLVNELQRMKAAAGNTASAVPDATLQKLEAGYRANPRDFSNTVALAQRYA